MKCQIWECKVGNVGRVEKLKILRPAAMDGRPLRIDGTNHAS